MYRGILFDLDGTLLDTSAGVKKSIEFTIAKMGLPALKEDEVDAFIGPPIYQSLQYRYELTDEETKKGTEIFRNVYKDKYLMEASVYPGMMQFLEYLKEKDVRIGIATYKREDYSVKLLEHFKIADYCDVIVGSDFENKLSKTDIVKKCFEKMYIQKEEAVLIGDTLHDAIGAKNFGIDFAAVTYGFGFKSISDLKNINYVICAANVPELRKLVK